VRTEGGKTGLYVPYIYVTTDVALAAGREYMGFPKKLADISLTRWSDMVQGTLGRPPGKRLIIVTMKPFDRFDPATREALVKGQVSIFNARHVPGLDSRGGLTQLFESSFEMGLRKDARANDIVFTGPVSVTPAVPGAGPEADWVRAIVFAAAGGSERWSGWFCSRELTAVAREFQ